MWIILKSRLVSVWLPQMHPVGEIFNKHDPVVVILFTIKKAGHGKDKNHWQEACENEHRKSPCSRVQKQ